MIANETAFPRSLHQTQKTKAVSPAAIPVLAFAAAAAALAWLDLSLTTTDPALLVSIGGTIASVGATMLGFLLASLAVLASINHTHLVNMMRKTGHFDDLLKTVFWGCMGFLLCTIVGFALLFGVSPPHWMRLCIIALHVAALASLIDVGRKFFLVFTSLRNA